MIYWLPTGVVLDTVPADGVGNFQTLHQRFFQDISGSLYANILLQYPGKCGTAVCAIDNKPGAIKLAGSFVDTSAYPGGKGTAAIPLQDSDIQAAINRAIARNKLVSDANTEFFVVTGVFKSTGAAVSECRNGTCNQAGGFCAYHSQYTNIAGRQVFYGFLSDANFTAAGGCSEGLVTAPNGQAASDQEVALLSHEFFETITDPSSATPTWVDNATGNEISDNCNQLGSNSFMNGNPYWVQQQWSNTTSSCVSSVDGRTACQQTCRNKGPGILQACNAGCKSERDDCMQQTPHSPQACVAAFRQCQSACGTLQGKCVAGCAAPPPPPPPPACHQACAATAQACAAACRSDRDSCFHDDPGSHLCVTEFRQCSTTCTNQQRACDARCH